MLSVVSSLSCNTTSNVCKMLITNTPYGDRSFRSTYAFETIFRCTYGDSWCTILHSWGHSSDLSKCGVTLSIIRNKIHHFCPDTVIQLESVLCGISHLQLWSCLSLFYCWSTFNAGPRPPHCSNRQYSLSPVRCRLQQYGGLGPAL
jgi:hypothetical protein